MKYVVLVVTLILLLGCISMTYAQSQQVRVAVESTAQGQYQAGVYYQPSDGRKTTGLGIRVHYQNSIIRVSSTSDVLSNVTGLQIQDDQGNHDQDDRTDRFVNAAWFELSGNWPASIDGEVLMFKINFELREPTSLQTVVFNVTPVSTASGYELSAGNYQAVLGSELGSETETHEHSRQLTKESVRAGAAQYSSSIDTGSDAQVRELLAQNPAALRAALDVSQALQGDWDPDAVALEQKMNERGLPAGLGATLAQALAKVVAIDAVSTPAGNAAEILFDALGSAAQLRQDPLTAGLEIVLPGERYQGMVLSVRVVSDLLPGGLRFLPDGQVVLVHQGYAFEIAPIVADLPAFVSIVGNAGFEFSMRDDGAIEINVGGGEHFVGAFAYDNLIESSGACGDMDVAAPVGSILSADYYFAVRCANGAQQRVVPFVHDRAFYQAMADLGNAVTTDRNTGLINIEGLGRYKPGYFLSPLTAGESDFLAANKDGNGVAIHFADINGNGMQDAVLMTAAGTQPMYLLQP